MRRGSGRRREVGGARGCWARAAGLWAATSMAAVLGDVGGKGDVDGADEKPSLRGKGEGGRKYMGGPFCPG